MTSARLQHAIREVPFKPFDLKVAPLTVQAVSGGRCYPEGLDSKTIAIRHPEFISHQPGSKSAVVTMPDGSTETFDLERLELAFVVSVVVREGSWPPRKGEHR